MSINWWWIVYISLRKIEYFIVVVIVNFLNQVNTNKGQFLYQYPTFWVSEYLYNDKTILRRLVYVGRNPFPGVQISSLCIDCWWISVLAFYLALYSLKYFTFTTKSWRGDGKGGWNISRWASLVPKPGHTQPKFVKLWSALSRCISTMTIAGLFQIQVKI